MQGQLFENFSEMRSIMALLCILLLHWLLFIRHFDHGCQLARCTDHCTEIKICYHSILWHPPWGRSAVGVWAAHHFISLWLKPTYLRYLWLTSRISATFPLTQTKLLKRPVVDELHFCSFCWKSRVEKEPFFFFFFERKVCCALNDCVWLAVKVVSCNKYTLCLLIAYSPFHKKVKSFPHPCSAKGMYLWWLFVTWFLYSFVHYSYSSQFSS